MVKLAQAGCENGSCSARPRGRSPGLDRPDRPSPADRRAHGCGQPGGLVASEPRASRSIRSSTAPRGDQQRRWPNPLDNADVIWNTSNWPVTTQPRRARSRPSSPPEAATSAQTATGQLPRRVHKRPASRHHSTRGRNPSAEAASSAGSTKAPRARSRVVPARGHRDRRPADLVLGGPGDAPRMPGSRPTDFFLPGLAIRRADPRRLRDRRSSSTA